jgi:hypothetical protein
VKYAWKAASVSKTVTVVIPGIYWDVTSDSGVRKDQCSVHSHAALRLIMLSWVSFYISHICLCIFKCFWVICKYNKWCNF